MKTATTKLKLQWDYTHEEIKGLVSKLIEEYKTKKIFNKVEKESDYKYIHKYSFEIPFSSHDGSYTHNLEICEWVEGKNKKPLYGLYIKAIQKDGRGKGEDWTSSEPVTKFYVMDEFLKAQVINDMYNYFQRNKKFNEDLKAGKYK